MRSNSGEWTVRINSPTPPIMQRIKRMITQAITSTLRSLSTLLRLYRGPLLFIRALLSWPVTSYICKTQKQCGNYIARDIIERTGILIWISWEKELWVSSTSVKKKKRFSKATSHETEVYRTLIFILKNSQPAYYNFLKYQNC